MLTLNDGRTELWQWDTGRTLVVDADCSQVHFSNKVFGRSIDVDVADGVAIIPDVLLQTDKDLTVWAFVGTAENGYTKISKTFKVNRRNKPADYVFTPVEQTTIAEIAEIAQSVRDDADAGLFDGKPGVNGRDGVDGKDGSPGKDGISATHSWNGTVLTITSASGTSSADLKGDKGDKGEQGIPGPPGHTPEYGVDYGTPEEITVIAQQAADILGPEVSQIKEDLSDLAPAGAAVGQLFRVASISEDGKYTMEPVDMLDVQISGTSVVTDGVANIPLGNSSKYGVAKFGSGLYVSNGNVSTNLAVASEISRRRVGRTIETSNIDIAVKAAMCDGKGSAWTAEEQAAARERMGIPGDYELIETFTLQEDSAWERTKEPNGNDYNFTSVFIYRLYPSRGSIHSSDYSHLYFYDFSGRALFADTGRTTDNRYNRANISILERKGGISMVKYTKTVDIGVPSEFLIRSLMGYGLDDQFGNVCKIKSYDPSGCVINIYGVRA